MRLVYLFHSGFAIETDHCVVIVDYWIDPTETVKDLLQTGKPVYVLASHHHEDHFNREVFRWKRARPDITYLLARDILDNLRADADEADCWFVKGDSWNDDNLRVSAFGSNDCGVSWLIELDGKRIFHAGDLNNWYAKFLTDHYRGRKIFSFEFNREIDPVEDERCFLTELDDIAKVTDSFDLVMFPVDGRIGNGYMLGARQFIERFKVRQFVPMHFVLAGFESAWRMKEYTQPAGIPFWAIGYYGESVLL